MKEHTFTISDKLFSQLYEHLFPGDNDEHGAVIAAGISEDDREVRFLAKEVFLAQDGKDYVPGKFGYRALTADFIADKIHYCSIHNLCYFAVHCHGGSDLVNFSSTDLESHKRGYPALLDIVHGGPVGALVFARNAVAGDIWTPMQRRPLSHMTVVGKKIHRIYPTRFSVSKASPVFDRNVRFFGDLGQGILSRLKVGIIGLGGGGSLLNEWLSRLGVGEIIAVDDDKIEPTNLPRVVGSTSLDAFVKLSSSKIAILKKLGRTLSRSKVSIAKRVAKKSNARIRFRSVKGNLLDDHVAQQLKNCDFVFLATDNIQSRLVFNALVYQYLIPGAQIGIQITFKQATNEIESIFTNTRLVLPFPGGGCLECHELIPPGKLQEESLSPKDRRKQRYVDSEDVPQPSVITLNAISGAQAVNDFMMLFTGLFSDNVNLNHLQNEIMGRQLFDVNPIVKLSCPDCSSHPKSRFAKGDRIRLPCRAS